MRKDSRERDADPSYNPQRALWQAVLAQAVEDALYGAPLSDSGSGDKQHRIRATKSTRDWLTTPSRDLAEVCHLAGLDPQAVMQHMRKRIAEAPTPEELVARRKPPKPKPAPKPPKQRNPTHYTLNGETLHISEWAARCGVAVNTIRNRISKGWPIEAALTVSNQEGARRARAAANSGWAYLTAKAEANPEPIAARPRRKGPATLTHDGRTLTYSEWAEHTGIPMRTIRTRLSNGWPVERVLDPTSQRGKTPEAEAA